MEWDRDSWVESDPVTDEPEGGIDILAELDGMLADDPVLSVEVDELVEGAWPDVVHAKTLASLRKGLGFTQKDLARRLGITQPTVSDFERGRYGNVGVASFLGYLDALGLHPRILVEVPGQGDVDVTLLAGVQTVGARHRQQHIVSESTPTAP